jgi:hypothetical protein
MFCCVQRSDVQVPAHLELDARSMYAKSLSMFNFRCFKKAVLHLQYPGRIDEHASELPNENLILGDNGGGKSSVLRSLTIVLLAPVLPESGFVPSRLVRRPGAKKLFSHSCIHRKIQDDLLQVNPASAHRQGDFRKVSV